MHATVSEVLWTVALLIATLASAYLTREAILDGRATLRDGRNGPRRTMVFYAGRVEIALAVVAFCLFLLAVSTLFNPNTAPISTRGTVIRWSAFLLAGGIVTVQLFNLKARRKIANYPDEAWASYPSYADDGA